MNKLYCWLPKPPNVGHASLAISVGEGPGRAEYVSWWPTGPTGTKGNQGAKPTKPAEKFKAAVSTYADDTASEGGVADLTVEITCLDEDRMRSAFKEMKKDLTYNMTYKSCATAVAQVLLAGGGCLSFDCLNYAKRVVWTPIETNRLALLINADARAIREGIANGFRPAAQFVVPSFRSGY